MTLEENPLNEDWRISQAQYNMITDKLKKMSKKEAGLLFDFMQHCIFNRRPETYMKQRELKHDAD